MNPIKFINCSFPKTDTNYFVQQSSDNFIEMPTKLRKFDIIEQFISHWGCKFQFYDSSIQSSDLPVFNLRMHCFNSKIVRLKGNSMPPVMGISIFQFYDSSIQRHYDIKVYDVPKQFQFYDSSIQRLR